MTYPWAGQAWSAAPRFFGYVEVGSEIPEGLATPCHCWTGAKSRGKGNTAWYGSFRVGRWVVRAHIFVAVLKGKMRPGMHVDHLCRNTLCVNGDHLEVVTPTINSERRWAAARKEHACQSSSASIPAWMAPWRFWNRRSSSSGTCRH